MIVLYIIFNFFSWLISKLPFRILYLISDLFFSIMYYSVGYRKRIVFRNLYTSFPEKSAQDIVRIAKQYYRNLCDIIIETIKKRGMREDDYKTRIKVKNIELVEKLYSQNKSIIAAVGHCGNFEWLVSYLSLLFSYKTYVTVKQLSNKYFDDFINKSRSVYGLHPYNHKNTFRVMYENKNILTMTIIAADQYPGTGKKRYWTSFLNQKTSFYLGVEKIAKMHNLAVIFVEMYKIKRGFYQIEFKLLTDEPKITEENNIIKNYVTTLEQAICRHPSDWLWSHRRWKNNKENQLNH